jgi:hypothetical protein
MKKATEIKCNAIIAEMFNLTDNQLKNALAIAETMPTLAELELHMPDSAWRITELVRHEVIRAEERAIASQKAYMDSDVGHFTNSGREFSYEAFMNGEITIDTYRRLLGPGGDNVFTTDPYATANDKGAGFSGYEATAREIDAMNVLDKIIVTETVKGGKFLSRMSPELPAATKGKGWLAKKVWGENTPDTRFNAKKLDERLSIEYDATAKNDILNNAEATRFFRLQTALGTLDDVSMVRGEDETELEPQQELDYFWKESKEVKEHLAALSNDRAKGFVKHHLETGGLKGVLHTPDVKAVSLGEGKGLYAIPLGKDEQGERWTPSDGLRRLKQRLHRMNYKELGSFGSSQRGKGKCQDLARLDWHEAGIFWGEYKKERAAKKPGHTRIGKGIIDRIVELKGKKEFKGKKKGQAISFIMKSKQRLNSVDNSVLWDLTH